MPVPDLVETSGDLDFDPKRGRLDINLLSDGAGFWSFHCFSPSFKSKWQVFHPLYKNSPPFFFTLKCIYLSPPKLAAANGELALRHYYST